MKNGLIWENGILMYYKNDLPYHAGVVMDGEKIYYIGRGGMAVKGRHVVHKSMANGILTHGTYTFGEDYAVVEGSYLAPVKSATKARKKRSKSKNPTKAERIKKKKQAVLIGVIAASFAVMVFGYVVWRGVTYEPELKAPSTNTTQSTTSQTVDKNHVKLPVFDKEVLLCSEQAKAAYDGNTTIAQATKGGDPYRAFTFAYELGSDGILRLSEKADLGNARKYVLSAKQTSLTIDNLKTDTTYYYAVDVNGKTYNGSFKTAASTRFVSFEKVPNTRDIGGYTTQDGFKVKQGMIIRGGELDGAFETLYYLEPENVERVLDDFGFVYDMDLRQKELVSPNFKPRFGSGVGHRFYNASAYGELFREANWENLRQIFSDLAQPSHYPMYLHCTYGKDRTGSVVFLLQALLNVSEDDLDYEYALSQYEYGVSAENSEDMLNVYYNELSNFKGTTLQEQTEDFLVNYVGVTPQEIEAIREILLEDAA